MKKGSVVAELGSQAMAAVMSGHETIELEEWQCGYRVREPGYGCSDVRKWDYRT